jgi:peptidoglycan/xylan/chitin deacetylase (PgdA/CDA1 family)
VSHYHVTESPNKGVVSPQLVVLLAGVLLLVLGLPAFGTITVEIDGETHRLEKGVTAHQAVTRGLAKAHSGDMVDVDGRVVVWGDGGEPVLRRGGATLSAEDSLHHGDVLTSVDGSNLLEPQVETMTPIPAPVEYQGGGPIEHVVDPGADGVLERGVGAISGKVTDVGVVKEAKPMLIERVYPGKGDKVVALTFDDGPWPGQTEAVLKILEAEDVKATFFMLGLQVDRLPAVAAKVSAAGHQVASHGYGHKYLTNDNKWFTKREVVSAQRSITKATGQTPTVLRAPGGALSDVARAQIAHEGLRIVRWDVDPQDWRGPGAWKLARSTLAEVRPGSVVLLHDGGGDRTSTVQALTTIIRKLKAQGYTFVTIDDLGPGTPQ